MWVRSAYRNRNQYEMLCERKAGTERRNDGKRQSWKHEGQDSV